MKRVRLGLCIGDREYGDRFTGCLMNHYREQLELHIFTDVKALWEERGNLDAIVLGDEVDPVLLEGDSPPVIYLCDGEENLDVLEGKGVFFVDK